MSLPLRVPSTKDRRRARGALDTAERVPLPAGSGAEPGAGTRTAAPYE